MKVLQNVTMREFAKVNNIDLARFRTLMRKTVQPSFSRKAVNYYDRVKLDEWLANNKNRFTEENKYKENVGLFFCSMRDHYVSVGKRSNKMSLCCVDCSRQSKSHQTIVAQRTPKRGDTVSPAVKKHHDDMVDMEFKRELSQLDNVDSWMYE